MKKSLIIKIIFVLNAVVLFSVTTMAHEYWFEPGKFMLAPDEKTDVHLYVGDGLIKDREERAFQLEKTPRFELFSTSKDWNLKTMLADGAMPVYNFSAAASGNYLLAMERNWSFIKIEPDKFEAYLHEDGLDYIIPERDKLNERKKEGRERYSRYLKSLFQVGDKHDNVYKKQLGLKLEITPLENPYAKKIGEKLSFRVLFDGKPLTNKVIFADNRNSSTQRMTTDNNGKFTMTIDKIGLWLVHMVYMQRCQASDCGEADWESYWGAITFGA